jgi:hypothetical protein
MAHTTMTLHTNSKDFAELIQLTATQFNIAPKNIEKDYWITLILSRFAQSSNGKDVVLQGETSLSKGYRLVNRFSEEINLAIIDRKNISGHALKAKFHTIEKEITSELIEIVEPNITCKHSFYRKSLFTYPTVIKTIPKRIIVEIDAFAYPYPYFKQEITSFITEYLFAINRNDTIEQYNLQPFAFNVLDKHRTMIEKLSSLIRFSFSEDETKAIASKICHFYDLYYLMNDKECAEYIQSPDFIHDLAEVLFDEEQPFDEDFFDILQSIQAHDQFDFDEPIGWQTKIIAKLPLATSFPSLWEDLRSSYQTELSQLAFDTIPDEKLVKDSFMKIIQRLL